MEKKLDLIINELQKMNSRMEHLEAQTNENTQLLKAVIHRQEETDAKLDNVTMDIHKNSNTTTKIYLHFTSGMRKSASDKMHAKFTELLTD